MQITYKSQKKKICTSIGLRLVFKCSFHWVNTFFGVGLFGSCKFILTHLAIHFTMNKLTTELRMQIVQIC